MNGLCDSYCKITLVPTQPKVTEYSNFTQSNVIVKIQGDHKQLK